MSACATLSCLIALAPVATPDVAPAPAQRLQWQGVPSAPQPSAVRMAAAERPHRAADWRIVQAAGNLIVLRDDRVVQTMVAPVAPPADGFAYER